MVTQDTLHRRSVQCRKRHRERCLRFNRIFQPQLLDVKVAAPLQLLADLRVSDRHAVSVSADSLQAEAHACRQFQGSNHSIFESQAPHDHHEDLPGRRAVLPVLLRHRGSRLVLRHQLETVAPLLPQPRVQPVHLHCAQSKVQTTIRSSLQIDLP